MNSKIQIIPTIILASLLVSLSVVPVYGQMRDIKPRTTPTTDDDKLNPYVNPQSFCTNLSVFENKILSRMNQREQERMKLKNTRLENLGENRSERTSNLIEKREEQDENRESLFKKLDDEADTEVRKEAVKEFQLTVEKAVETRRTSIDSAIKTFRADVDKLVSDRDVAVNSAVAKYRNAVQTAFDKADSSCDKNTAPATIRTTLKADLKKASDTLKTDISSIEKARDQIQELNEIRTETIQEAIETFKKEIAEARAALEKAISTVGDSQSTTMNEE